MLLNYGFEKFLFAKTAQSGRCIRTSLTHVEFLERRPGDTLLSFDVQVEINEEP